MREPTDHSAALPGGGGRLEKKLNSLRQYVGVLHYCANRTPCALCDNGYKSINLLLDELDELLRTEGGSAPPLAAWPPRCAWDEDEDGVWRTDCGHVWIFADSDTPTDHQARFCFYCGLPITAHANAARVPPPAKKPFLRRECICGHADSSHIDVHGCRWCACTTFQLKTESARVPPPAPQSGSTP